VSDSLDDVLGASDLVSVLTRDVSVRVANISASGCLIESDRRLEVGTVGALRLDLGGQEYREDVRIVRAQELRGAGARWQVGVEFLWTSSPGPQSLRRVVGLLATRLAGEMTARFEFDGRRPM